MQGPRLRPKRPILRSMMVSHAGSRGGSAAGSAPNPALEKIDLVAKIGGLPADWWSHPAPSPPPWPSPVIDPWVQVTTLPGEHQGGPLGHPEAISVPYIGWGVIFDPQAPDARGIPTYVLDVFQPNSDNAAYLMATISVPEDAWPGWPKAQGPAQAKKIWVAATTSEGRPPNAASQWVKITHTPGTGPSINGQPTEQGRGILYTIPHDQVGTVIVYGVRQDRVGWLAEVSIYETPSSAVPSRFPTCLPSEAMYENEWSMSGWPAGNSNRYLCGIPQVLSGPDPLCGQDDSFRLRSEKPPEVPPSAPGAPGAPTPPSQWPRYCGTLSKDPKGAWLPATFFDEAPSGPTGRRRLWIQIKQPPGYQGHHFGQGILHHNDRIKDVLLVEIGGTQGHPKARYVPNDNNFHQDKSSQPGPSGSPFTPPGIGTTPLGLPPKRSILRRLFGL